MWKPQKHKTVEVLFERIDEKRLLKVLKLNLIQVGFLAGTGTFDAIFIMQQVPKKYEVAGRKPYLVFMDLEKAFGRFQREEIRLALRRKGLVREN